MFSNTITMKIHKKNPEFDIYFQTNGRLFCMFFLYNSESSILIFAYKNFCNIKYSENRITCGTIIIRQICSACTPSVRVSTCVNFTVWWTFHWTVGAKISFYTDYGINVKRNHKCFKISNPQILHKISQIGMFQVKITDYVLDKWNKRYFTRHICSNVLFRWITKFVLACMSFCVWVRRASKRTEPWEPERGRKKKRVNPTYIYFFLSCFDWLIRC